MKETDWLNSNPCISGKPVVYLINLNEDKYIKKKSKWLPKVVDMHTINSQLVVVHAFLLWGTAWLSFETHACCLSNHVRSCDWTDNVSLRLMRER